MSKLETVGDYLNHPSLTSSLWGYLIKLVKDQEELEMKIAEHNAHAHHHRAAKVKLRRSTLDILRDKGMIPGPFVPDSEKDRIIHLWVNEFTLALEKKSTLSSRLRHVVLGVFQKVFREIQEIESQNKDKETSTNPIKE